MLGDLENVEVVRFAIFFQFYQYLMFDISSEKKPIVESFYLIF